MVVRLWLQGNQLIIVGRCQPSANFGEMARVSSRCVVRGHLVPFIMNTLCMVRLMGYLEGS